MGLFYNYNKEGPGISKNGPKKRTFIVFFETFFRNVWKLIPVSFMYCLLFIIPGFSAVGITYVTRSLSRDRHTFGVSDFFLAIKKNWKQALCVGFLNHIITAFILFDISLFRYLSLQGKFSGLIGLGISVFILLVFITMKFYIYFIVITFDMKIKQIYLNSFKFFVLNMANNIVMFIAIGLYWALWFFLLTFFASNALVAGILAVVTIFVYPTYHYLVVQYGIFQSIKKYMIDPYYEEHPDADIDKRRNLGLDVDEEDIADFEDVI